MIAQHMIRSYTHKIWCYVVMKYYKYQIKYIRHCSPVLTPGLTPVPSRSDAPATWSPSFLRDLAGFQPQMLGFTVTLTSKSILILIFNGSTLYTYIYIYTFFFPTLLFTARQCFMV